MTWDADAKADSRDFFVNQASADAVAKSLIDLMAQNVGPEAKYIIVTGSLMVATAILTEAGLAFLGLGDPNVMSWGTIIGAGREVLRSAWYVCTLPGLAILLTVLGLNLVGEGLNDALNPRLRER